MTALLKYRSISWDTYGKLVARLEKLIPTTAHYDCVVAIPRGGLPVGVALAHHLDIPLVALKIQPPHIFGMSPDFRYGGSALLVDDISDKGHTLRQAYKYLKGFYPKVDTATLYYQPTTKFMPTFTVAKTTKYIVFPYEKPPL